MLLYEESKEQSSFMGFADLGSGNFAMLRGSKEITP